MMFNLNDVRNHTELGTGYTKDAMLNLCADEITSLRAELEKAKKDGERNSWMVRHNAYISWSQDSEVCSVWIIGDCRDEKGDYPAQGYPLKSYNTKEEAIDNAMKAK